jgi:hypothetical protein
MIPKKPGSAINPLFEGGSFDHPASRRLPRQSMRALMTDDRKLVSDISRMDNTVDKLDEAIKGSGIQAVLTIREHGSSVTLPPR